VLLCSAPLRGPDGAAAPGGHGGRRAAAAYRLFGHEVLLALDRQGRYGRALQAIDRNVGRRRPAGTDEPPVQWRTKVQDRDRNRGNFESILAVYS
jgi:hypothetical protein